MPALTMRGRYLMREYWSDTVLFLKLDAAEREVYIGLWMLADDDGWLPRDVPGIAGALLRYADREPREAQIRLALRRLGAIGKVKSLRCGCLYLPAVSKYPRAGRKSSEHRLSHVSRHPNSPDIQTSSNTVFKDIQSDSNSSPVPTLPNPTLPGAPAREDETSFDELMAAGGLRPQLGGGKRVS